MPRVKASGYRGLGQTEDDAEGQIYILKKREPGEQLDDTQGQGRSYFLDPDDDTEGQGRSYFLEPASADDTEGQQFRKGNLRPTEDDTEGQARGYFLEPDDTEGQQRRPRP